MTTRSARELLDKALKRRSEIQIEADALDSLIRMYNALLQIPDRDGDSGERQPDLYKTLTNRAIQAGRINQMIEVARKIMIAEKRPLKRGELVKRLENQGYEIVGLDKNKVFGTNIWRSGKFIRVEGRGYWPSDIELPT